MMWASQLVLVSALKSFGTWSICPFLRRPSLEQTNLHCVALPSILLKVVFLFLTSKPARPPYSSQNRQASSVVLNLNPTLGIHLSGFAISSHLDNTTLKFSQVGQHRLAQLITEILPKFWSTQEITHRYHYKSKHCTSITDTSLTTAQNWKCKN